MAATLTCHSRWCVFAYNDSWSNANCENLLPEIRNYFGNPTTSESDAIIKLNYACCKLYCGQNNQLFQLQCQGTSPTMAIATWFIVLTLMFFSVLFLVVCLFERGFGRLVALLGGVSFLSFTALIAYVFGGNKDLLDTPLYPVIGAMNVAAFSYLFSGYQYSISLVYELASAATLLFTMIPIWALLTIDIRNIVEDTSSPYDEPDEVQKWSAIVAGSLAVAMLCVSTLWVIHSSLYRTVGYMAAWIRAFTAQQNEPPSNPRNLMCSLWVLAAADGHPTWRTPVGQSMGLYLLGLSWGVCSLSKKYLDNTCNDDFILFKLMMWFPPALLMVAVIANQGVMFAKQTACPTQEMFFDFFQGRKRSEIQKLYTKAVIIYRLGRKGMDVSVHDDYYRYTCWGIDVDKALAKLVIGFEKIFLVVAFPGYLIIRLLQYLVRRILPSATCCLRGCLCSYCERECEPERRKAAFKVLCDHCGVMSSEPRNCENQDEIRLEIRKLLGEHLDKIDLPLLLDNIHPSGLSYLIEQLVHVTSHKEQQPLNSIRVSRGTSMTAPRSSEDGTQPLNQNAEPWNDEMVPNDSLATPHESADSIAGDPSSEVDDAALSKTDETPPELHSNTGTELTEGLVTVRPDSGSGRSFRKRTPSQRGHQYELPSE